MCAAAMQIQGAKVMAGWLGIRLDLDAENFAGGLAYPLQQLAYVRRLAGADQAELTVGQFGLVPDWVGDDKGGPKFGRYCYNARSETVFEKPSFRQAILKRRAVLPVHAFFEFPDKETPLRRRLRVQRKDGEPMLLAALWERNERYKLDSFTILTGEPLDLVASVQSRSPILLEANQMKAWMDPDMQDRTEILSYLKVTSSKELKLEDEPWGKSLSFLDLF